MCVYTNTPNMHVYTYILYTIYVYACVPLYSLILYVQYLQFVIIIQYKNALRIKNPLKKETYQTLYKFSKFDWNSIFRSSKIFMHTIKWGMHIQKKKTLKIWNTQCLLIRIYKHSYVLLQRHLIFLYAILMLHSFFKYQYSFKMHDTDNYIFISWRRFFLNGHAQP